MGDLPLLGHPSLPLLVAAVLVAFVPRRVGSVLVLVAPVASLVLVVAGRGAGGVTIQRFGVTLEPLRLDTLSTPFAGTFAIAAFLIFLYGLRLTGRTERVAGLVTAASAIGVAAAGDLITLFVWWELKAVATAVVVLAGPRTDGGRAALRYLYTHLAGGGALLAGIGWYAASTGTTAFVALDAGPAAVLIGIGFLVSAAAPPMHAWLPDAYPVSTVTGSVLLSAFTTKAAVYALARGLAGADVLLWVGVSMALYGVVYAMMQDDLRRLLSYHIVSQVGFMVAAVGVGTAEAINGATAHAVAHIVYKGLLLMGVGAVIHATGRDRATDLGGLARVMPAALVLYLIGALSISGVPLFSGFVSKELSIHAIGDAGASAAVVALKVASVGTLLSTLGKLPYATWIAPPAGGVVPAVVRRPTPTMYAAMALAATVCVAVGLVPGLLWDLLPSTVTYTPYYLGKVAETVQLLGVAALGFWLLRRQLAPHAGAVRDVDRLYGQVAVRASRVRLLDRPRPAGAARSALTGVVRSRLAALPATSPTWWFGVVVASAALAFVVGSVA